MKKILFICQCNVCRSPMAEFLLKAMTTDVTALEITSMGISNEKCGCDMTDGAKACLAAHGIPYERRAATVFCAKEYLNYDMLICMDEWCYFQLKLQCFGDPAGKICKLLALTRSTDGMTSEDAMLYTNVSDPYGTSDYEKTFRELYEGCTQLKKILLEES